jgi:hypothetical protein
MQAADRLDDEEGIAVGAVVQERHEVGRRVLAQLGPGKAGRVVRVEWLEGEVSPHRAAFALGRDGTPRDLGLGAPGQDDQERALGARVHELCGQRKRCLVHPLEVLDEQDPSRAIAPRQPGPHCAMQAAAERFRLQGDDLLVRRIEAEHPCEIGDARGRSESTGGARQRSPSFRRRVVDADACPAPDQLCVRGVPDRAPVADTPSREPDEAGGPSDPGSRRDERRLADARRTEDRDEPAATTGERLDGRGDAGQLALAADQVGAGLDTGPCRCFAVLRAAPLAEKPPGGHGLRLALDRQLTDGIEAEAVTDERHRRSADVRLSAGSLGFESLGHDDRVTEHAIVEPRLAAHDPCDDVAGVHADVEGEAFRTGPQLGDGADHLSVHLQRDQQRPCGVVIVRPRGAEHGQDRIAGVLLDGPLEARDDRSQPRHERIDDLHQLLAVDALRQRGEAGDVGEQRRDEPALFGELAPRAGHGTCARRIREPAQVSSRCP